MKKITIIASHLYYGGIEKYISYLCKMFENDFDVEILTVFKRDEKPVFEFSNKIKITYLTNEFPYIVSIKKLLEEKKYYSVFKEFFRRVFLKIKSEYKLHNAIKNLNSDFVITTRYTHNKLVNKYLKNSNIIKIATEHNYHNNIKKYINRVVDSTTNFDYFIHCTKEMFDFYSKIIKGPKNILLESPVYINNNLKSKLNNMNLISVGRLSYEKGFDDLILVMKELVKLNSYVRLTICGDGPEKEKLKQQIENNKLSDNINLAGFLNSDELAIQYSNASIYVLPSRSEAFGLVLLEAMHYGLPCIAFDTVSGARELLGDGTGILIKNRNKKEMANKINELLKNSEELKKVSKKSVAKVVDFSLDKTYEKWKKILK